jgi:peptide/nickel transport system permease protein
MSCRPFSIRGCADGRGDAPAAAPAGKKGGSGRPDALHLLLNNTLATGGLVVFALIVFAALAAPLLPLPDPDVTAPANRLLRPFAEGHLLGTDALGRDILSRLLWGTRVSLLVGISATLIAAFFGSLIGLVAGYAGGRVDTLLMRGIDMVMAFPYILLALAIVAVLGPGLLNALYAIAVVNIPVLRAQHSRHRARPVATRVRRRGASFRQV